MTSNYTHPSGGNTILLFGPQALSFRKDDFDQLRVILHEPKHEHRWIIDTLAELPTYWKSFEAKFPKLQAVEGKKFLDDLNDALKNGSELTHDFSTLPNILLSPLVVITHLTQYTKYLTTKHAGKEQDIYAIPSQNTETVGYCTGLLSALAVSSTTNRSQFERYGAVAIRLALLISGFVDAQEILDENKGSIALATVWNAEGAKIEMEKMMKEFPEVCSHCHLPNFHGQ